MSAILFTFSLIVIWCNLPQASDFTLSQTSLPTKTYAAATAIVGDKLVLINGYFNDSVYSIDISLLFDGSDNENSWQLIQKQNNMNIPFNGQNVKYPPGTSVQLNNIIYGVPQYEANNEEVYGTNLYSNFL